MRIIHLVPAMEEGGVESAVCSLNRAVAGSGHESFVVSIGGRLVETVERDGGHHVVLDLKSKNPITYFTRALRLRRTLAELSAGATCTVVCAHSRVPAWLFAWANRTLRLPWLSYAHGANRVSRYSGIMTRGDLVVAPSRFLAGFLIENYGDAYGGLPLESRIRVIGPCVDTDRFDPDSLDGAFVAEKRREWGVGPGTFVTMSVGRITPVKGFDAVIRDFAERSASTGAQRRKLVIVGGAAKGKERHLEELKALAAKLCQPDSVVFAGGQSRMPECLSLADEVVSGNTKKPESFGLSVAEALAMNKPVRLLRRFGGAAEILDDVAAAGMPTTRDAVKALYGPGAVLAKTLAAYTEAAK